MLKARLRRPSGTQDRGSIIVAVAVIMVLVILGATLTARTIANLGAVRHTQDFSSALANADAGVSDALFQLDQFGPANPPPASGEFCVGPEAGCANPSMPGDASVQYKAVQLSATEWEIQSLGSDRGVPHGAQALVTRSVAYPYALFGNQGLDFNGSASNGFSSYDSSQPEASGSNPDPNGAVSIGSNGVIDCHGGVGGNVTAVYYTGGGGVAGHCGPSPQAMSSRYLAPVPQAPASAVACPNGGSIGSSAGVPTIAAGTYVCPSLTISGSLSLAGTGQVLIYVIVPDVSSSQNTVTVDIAPGSTVNIPGSPQLPVAEDFQILSNTQGEVGSEHGQTGAYTFGGIIEAPNASLVEDGCASTYYGALVLNTFTCNGGPHLTVNYDSQLRTDYTPWSVSSYTEVPSSSITIP